MRGINDVLLTALALAVAQWCRQRRAHARQRAVRGADRARGPWPRGGLRRRRPLAHGGLVHQPVPGAARSGRARSGALDRRRRWRAERCWGALKRIKEQLRALPDHGLGYGLLRYLNPQTAEAAGLAADAAARLQLSGPVCGAGRGRLAAARRRRCGSAAAIPPCRCAMPSRSMRSRSTAGRSQPARHLVVGAGAAQPS